jgi:hypothetical protein
MRLEVLGKLKNTLISYWNRIRDLLTCSIVSERCDLYYQDSEIWKVRVGGLQHIVLMSKHRIPRIKRW